MDIEKDMACSSRFIAAENPPISLKTHDNRTADVSHSSDWMMTCRESDSGSPILGHHFKLPDFSKSFDPDPPTLDSTLPYIPVYTHMITHDLLPIERPKTPPIMNQLRKCGAIQLKNHSKSKSPSNTRADGTDQLI